MNTTSFLFSMSSFKINYLGRFAFYLHEWSQAQEVWWHLQSTVVHALKTLGTNGNCQRPVFLLAVSQHINKITKLWKFEFNLLSKLRDNNERKKPLSPLKVECFQQMLDFETSSSKSEVSKSNSRKITYFSKTTLLQREPFLTMFYAINSSPILITK